MVVVKLLNMLVEELTGVAEEFVPPDDRDDDVTTTTEVTGIVTTTDELPWTCVEEPTGPTTVLEVNATPEEETVGYPLGRL